MVTPLRGDCTYGLCRGRACARSGFSAGIRCLAYSSRRVVSESRTPCEFLGYKVNENPLERRELEQQAFHHQPSRSFSSAVQVAPGGDPARDAPAPLPVSPGKKRFRDLQLHLFHRQLGSRHHGRRGERRRVSGALGRRGFRGLCCRLLVSRRFIT